METLRIDDLLKRAKEVLNRNWLGSYTKPGPQLYPHQWNWDSGFITIGYASYDQVKAMSELRTLFKGQWHNGMVPQIVFHKPSTTYFPDADDWRADLSRDAPAAMRTSGITQPPIHATAVWTVYEKSKNKTGVIAFLDEMFPKLLASHRFFYRYRDPEQIGLVVSVHPWETGIDNSPKWDIPLQNMKIDGIKLPPFQRKDLDLVPSSERPSDDTYNKFVFLVEFFKKLKYDQKLMAKECPFLVYDVLFNSVLQRANHDLVKIGEVIRVETAEIESWIEKSKESFDRRLWTPEQSVYHAYDLVSQSIIYVHTGSCALPLFGLIPDREKAESMTKHFFLACPFGEKGLCASVPSYDETQPGFHATNYWRGPIWVNVNWMLYKGLSNYGFAGQADKIRLNIFRLTHEAGFREYYHPTELKGLGSKNFSWSAALVIDLLQEKGLKEALGRIVGRQVFGASKDHDPLLA